MGWFLGDEIEYSFGAAYECLQRVGGFFRSIFPLNAHYASHGSSHHNTPFSHIISKGSIRLRLLIP